MSRGYNQCAAPTSVRRVEKSAGAGRAPAQARVVERVGDKSAKRCLISRYCADLYSGVTWTVTSRWKQKMRKETFNIYYDYSEMRWFEEMQNCLQG